MRTKSRTVAEINYPSLTSHAKRKEFPVTFPFAITKQSETNQLIFTKCLYLIEQYDQIQEETIYGTEHVLFSV